MCFFMVPQRFHAKRGLGIREVRAGRGGGMDVEDNKQDAYGSAKGRLRIALASATSTPHINGSMPWHVRVVARTLRWVGRGARQRPVRLPSARALCFSVFWKRGYFYVSPAVVTGGDALCDRGRRIFKLLTVANCDTKTPIATLIDPHSTTHRKRRGAPPLP